MKGGWLLVALPGPGILTALLMRGQALPAACPQAAMLPKATRGLDGRHVPWGDCAPSLSPPCLLGEKVTLCPL